MQNAMITDKKKFYDCSLKNNGEKEQYFSVTNFPTICCLLKTSFFALMFFCWRQRSGEEEMKKFKGSKLCFSSNYY